MMHFFFPRAQLLFINFGQFKTGPSIQAMASLQGGLRDGIPLRLHK